MYQTIEATVQNGRIVPLEPIDLPENTRFLLVRLPDSRPTQDEESPFSEAERQRRVKVLRASRGKYRGMLSSVDEFIASKEAEKELDL